MVAGKHWNDRKNAVLTAGLVGFALNIPPEKIMAVSRTAHGVTRARQAAMYLAHTGFGMSLARVAAAFGRDRSTVAHACRLVEDRREEPEFDGWVAALEDGLGAVAVIDAEVA